MAAGIGQAVGQDGKIHAGAADKNRNAVHGAHLRQRRDGIVTPAPHRIDLACADMAVQKMRHAGLIFARWLRRKDGRFAIDLHGIGIDDCAVDRLRQRQRLARLAAGGGACNKNGVKFHA